MSSPNWTEGVGSYPTANLEKSWRHVVCGSLDTAKDEIFGSYARLLTCMLFQIYHLS